MGAPRGFDDRALGALGGDAAAQKRLFQDQLRRELKVREVQFVQDRRVRVRAPSRKMTASGDPLAAYILEGDAGSFKGTLRPVGPGEIPSLTSMKLATFADEGDTNKFKGDKLKLINVRGKQTGAEVHEASEISKHTKPDVTLRGGGAGGGTNAFRFRKAVYGGLSGKILHHRHSFKTTAIVFDDGKKKSTHSTRRGRPSTATRGKYRPQVSRGKQSGVPPKLMNKSVNHFPAFPGADVEKTENSEWSRPVTPDESTERSAVLTKGRQSVLTRPVRMALGPTRPDAGARLRLVAATRALSAALALCKRHSNGRVISDEELVPVLDAAVTEAHAAGLGESARKQSDVLSNAENKLAKARVRVSFRVALTEAVTWNQPSSLALEEAKLAGIADNDPAVLAMKACVNRREREAATALVDREERFLSDGQLEEMELLELEEMERLEGEFERRAALDADEEGLDSETYEKRKDEPSASHELSASDDVSPTQEPPQITQGSLLFGKTLRVEELVGEGAYGRVMRCVDLQSNTTCAVKEFKINENDPDVEEVRRTSEREVKALRHLSHPNIVTHLGDFYQGTKLYVAMEFVPRTLLQILQSAGDAGDENISPRMDSPSPGKPPRSAGGLPYADVKHYTFQLCHALAYLHEKGYVYRDVKPENLLVDDVRVLKLCDFGFARELNPVSNESNNSNQTAGKHSNAPLTDYVATRWYRAPELLLGQPYRSNDGSGQMTRAGYGQPVDMWAVGCLMGELRDGEPMFPGDNDLDQLRLVQRTLGRLTPGQMMAFSLNPHNADVAFAEDEIAVQSESLNERYKNIFDDTALDFVKKLLELNPRHRMTGKQCLEHAYFEGLEL